MPKPKKSKTVAENPEEKGELSRYFLLEQKIRELESVGHPGHYGLPDLLFPKGYSQGFYDLTGDRARENPKITQFQDGWCRERLPGIESDEEYRLRQDTALEKFVTESMFIMKDGRQVYVKIIGAMRDWLGSVFFGRETKTITWKPRGGGGSLTAAVLIFLLLIYHKRSVLDLAGSAEQSKIVYEYVKAFWDIIPGLKEGLVDGDPLTLVTRLKSGQELRCSPSTEKQARGKHFSVIFVDELCLLPGTKVLTERGLIPVESLVVGDKIINKDGKITTVKRLWSKEYEGEAVEIKPAGWAEGWKLTANHPVFQADSVLRWKSSNVRKAGEFSWRDAGEVSNSSWAYYPKAKRSLSRGCIPLWFNAESARWLGYWLGDGWTNPGRSRNIHVVFNKNDKKNIDDYADLVSRLFNRSPLRTVCQAANRKNTVTIQFTSKELADWLDTTFGVGALNKSIPWDFIEQLSEKEVIQVLVGFARSDGSLWDGRSSSGGRCRRLAYRTSSDRLASSLHYLLMRVGIVSSTRRMKARWSIIRGKKYWTKESWAVDVNGEAMEGLAGIIDPDWKRISSRNNWKKIDSDGNLAVPIKQVNKFYYEGPVWDIEVESGDSFVLPCGVVHNCQKDPRVEAAMRAAIQGALSEPDPIICLFSTFHIPVGLFQEYWDNYEERGFSRFNWNILDTMTACKRGIETATPEDPKALEFCKGCFLTDKKQVKDATGNAITEVWTGCNGYARDAKGWATFESVCTAKSLNLGTGVFETEFLCLRPGFTSSVYSPELIEDSLVDPLLIDPKVDKVTIGIDWGIQTADSLAIIMAVRKPEYVYIADILYADHTLVSDVVTVLNQYRTKYGDFVIVADASHQFNNGDLAAAGFDIRPASFGTWKKFGIENITKHLVFHRIRINKTLTKLIDQLKHYRKNPTTGAIVKKNDHGPDSLNFAMLNYKFEEEFGPDIDKAVVIHEEKRTINLPIPIKTIHDKPVFDGVASPTTCNLTTIVGAVIPKKDKNVMVF